MSTTAYVNTASQAGGGGSTWTNLTNIIGAPDGSNTTNIIAVSGFSKTITANYLQITGQVTDLTTTIRISNLDLDLSADDELSVTLKDGVTTLGTASAIVLDNSGNLLDVVIASTDYQSGGNPLDLANNPRTNPTFHLDISITSVVGTVVNIDSAKLDATIAAPIAAFTRTPTTGVAPLAVTFTDTSTGVPTSWFWNFGDGTSSTSQNPTHTFKTGTFTITLTATNAVGSASITHTVTGTTPRSGAADAGGIWRVKQGDGATDPTSGLNTTWANARGNMPASGDLHSGDIIYIRGSIFGVTLIYDSKNSLGIYGFQYDSTSVPFATDSDVARLFGGTRPDPSAWSVHNGNTYKCTFPVIYGISGVFIGYKNSATNTAEGFPTGWTPQASSLSNCVATANTWWHDGVSTLYVNANGTNLTTAFATQFPANAVYVCDTDGRDILSVSTAASPSIQGIQTLQNPHTTNGHGYGIRVEGCSNPTVDGNGLYDCGPHAALAYSCTGNIVLQNNYAEGGTDDCAYFGAYSGSGNVDKVYDGSNICTFRRWLKRNGTEPALATGHETKAQSHSIAHTDGAGGHVVSGYTMDLWTAKVVAGYHTENEPTPIILNQVPTVSEANRLTESAYGVKVQRGSFINGAIWLMEMPHLIRWNLLDFSRTGISTLGIANPAWGSLTMKVNRGVADTYCLVSANSIIVDLSDTDGSHVGLVCRVFDDGQVAGGRDRMILLNNSIYNKSTQSASNFKAFCGYTNQTYPAFEGYGNIFEHKTASTVAALCIGDSTVSAVNHLFSDNVYKNIDDSQSRWSQQSNCNTSTKWKSTVDAVQDIETGVIFPLASTSLSLNQASVLWTKFRATSSVVPSAGINGPYTGSYGAYQNGTSLIQRGHSRGGRSRRRR